MFEWAVHRYVMHRPVQHQGAARHLRAPHAQPSPVLHRRGDALPRPQGLARHRVPALRAGGVHPDVDPGRPHPRQPVLAQRRLALHVHDHGHVPDLRVHALLLPRGRELVRAQLPVRQHAAAPSHRPSQRAADDGDQHEPDVPDRRLAVRHVRPRPRPARPPLQRLRRRRTSRRTCAASRSGPTLPRPSRWGTTERESPHPRPLPARGRGAPRATLRSERCRATSRRSCR